MSKYYKLNFAFLVVLMATSTSLGAEKNATADYQSDAGQKPHHQLLSSDDAVHLIMRTGFGVSPVEIDSVLESPREQAVQNFLSTLDNSSHSSLPLWVNAPAPNFWRRHDLPQSEKQRFSTYRDNEIEALRNWWIAEMISTSNPQIERLVLFWHNHFSTSFSAISKNSTAIAKQHLTIRKHASGNFRTLLKEIIRDPAMLDYLDNNVSKKQKPNENLARELLELFSLGEGNYTETDVKNAARALTGYTYSTVQNMQFVFRKGQHDKDEKTIFGVTGKFDGDDLVDLILAQPEAARFITAKMWREYIGDIETDDERLTVHADRFRQSNYDIKTLYASLLKSDDFWHLDNRKTLIQSPLSLTIGTIRTTGELPIDWQTISQQAALMGQNLFEPPNVAGWPGGEAWVTPGRLLTRMDWLKRMQYSTSNKDENMMTNMSMSSTMDENASLDMTMSNMNTEGQLLTLQLASEEYEGPANYIARINTTSGRSWDSGMQTLTGGHQTERMGRVTQQGMPWQYVKYAIPFTADQIEKIDISFTNDAAKSGKGDRNLFVKRAIVGDKTWLAFDGEQNSSCRPKSASRQGNLYCNGTLSLTTPLVTQSKSNQPTGENTLTSTGVYMNYVHKPEKEPRAVLAFRLSDAQLGDRSWSTLGFSYVKDRGEYAISISSAECWPECFKGIPQQCLHRDEPFIKTTTVYLKPKSTQKCTFENLGESGKQLIQALASLSVRIYNQGSETYKLNKPHNQRSYVAWKHHIQSIQGTATQALFHDADFHLNVIEHTQIDHTATEVLQTPLPAGITLSERQDALASIKARAPENELPTILTAKDHASVLAALTELRYQLR